MRHRIVQEYHCVAQVLCSRKAEARHEGIPNNDTGREVTDSRRESSIQDLWACKGHAMQFHPLEKPFVTPKRCQKCSNASSQRMATNHDAW